MEALTLFNQNFAVAESLLQVHRLFEGLDKAELSHQLRLAVCRQWQAPENSIVQHACNDRVSVLARATTRIPESLTLEGGLDFLLRQAVVVACTSLESFVWDALRENVLTVIRARRNRAHESLRNIGLTLGDYISIQQYEDPDIRLKQLVLKSFRRGTLYDVGSIEEIAKILTVDRYWERVAETSGVRAKDLKTSVGDLITRRNQIAHRADRPDEEEEADGHGLRPITYAWTNRRVRDAETLVTASAQVFAEAITRLEADIQAAEEQELARRHAAST